MSAPRRIPSIVALSVLTLSACVPFPNRRLCAPEVTGSLVRAGEPVAGAEIVLTAAFMRTPATTRTDAAGRFKLGPLTKMYLTKSLLGDPLYVYSLRIKTEGGEDRLGFEARSMGAPPGPRAVSCDLSKPVSKRESTYYCR